MANGDTGHRELELLLPLTLLKSDLIKTRVKDFSLSNASFRLQRIIFLRALEDYLSTVSIDEDIIETLEILEEYHRRDDSPVTSAMAGAYCAVAVECTLKYLTLGLNYNNAYLNAVERIWRSRVQCMYRSDSSEKSLLFSAELEQWRRDIEISLLDLQMRERLASVDSRRNAVAKLRAFLDEQWAYMGIPFVGVAPSLMQPKQFVTTKYSVAQHHLREIQKFSSVAAEKEHLSTTIEVQRAGECEFSELRTLVKDPLLDSLNANGAVLLENLSRDADVICLDSSDDNEVEAMENNQIDSLLDSLKVGEVLPLDDQCRDADVLSKKVEAMEKNQNSLLQSPDHRPSLMEKNSTASTSEDRASNRARHRLPIQRRSKRLPLKIDDNESARRTKRRPKRKWSKSEKETLIEAVAKVGQGHWKSILCSHKQLFVARTEVDLKDKWRNIVRYGHL